MVDINDSIKPRETDHLKMLAREAIALYGFSASAEIELVDYRENAVFKVSDNKTNKQFALRIHRAGYHNEKELESELQWMVALNEAGVSTPEVQRGLNGNYVQSVKAEGSIGVHHCDVLEWVKGATMAAAKASSPQCIADHYRIIGKLSAQIHSHSDDWTPPQGFSRQSWDEDGLLGEKPLWGGFWELEQLGDEQRDLLSAARDIAREQLINFGKRSDRYGLIHADLLPDNILVDGDNINIIDFDDAGYGWHLYDLATSLFSFIDTDNFSVVKDNWVRGYRTVKDLPQDHLKLLPSLLIARGLITLGWFHTRQETEHARSATQNRIQSVCAMARRML